MNDGNEISHHTKLYGFIGESAGQSSFAATLNRCFKANNKDAMMIPMNIREDDLFFTLSNMKKSHVNGAVISYEYVSQVVELLDESTNLVKRSGMCDILVKDGEKLVGDIFFIRVLTAFLKDNFASKIALIGVGPFAKVLSFFSCGFNISYYNDDLEALMRFTQETELRDADMHRIASGMSIDLSQYDAVIDFSDLTNLDMVEKFAPINIDMKHKKLSSALRVRTQELGSEYMGFDNFLEPLSEGAYSFFQKKGHLKDDKSTMKF